MGKMMDVSMMRINTLDPKLIPTATRVFEKCHKQRIHMYVTWGSRSKEEQDLLFRFGRTIPGKIVTSNRSGYSPHQYGLALDFCLLWDTQLLTWEEVYPQQYWRNKWLKAIRLFEEEGWVSKWRGIDFEPGHVENLMGYNIGELYENDVRNSWEQNLRK